jgi:hypothetical protein
MVSAGTSAVGLLLVGLVATPAAWGSSLRFALPALVAAAVLASARRRLAPSMLSPVKIVVGGYVGTAVLGLLFYDRVADARTGAGIRLYPTREVELDTVQLLLIAAAAVAVGASIVVLLLPGTGNVDWTLRPIIASERTRRLVLLLSVLPLTLTIVDYGLGDLLQRETYLRPSSASAGFANIGPSLSIPALLGLGYVFAAGRAGHRIVAVPLIAVYSMQFFALGSRRMTLIPLLLAAGGVAATLSRRAKLALAATAVLAVLLTPLPLYLRALPSHGLIPYLRALPAYAHQPFDLASIALSFLITFALVGTVAYHVAPIPAADFLTALNPLPGALTGWYEIEPAHRLNTFTPFAAVGELGNAGVVTLVAYLVAVGAVLGYLDRRVRLLLAAGQQMAALALVGFAGLFMLFSIEYFLRTATRFIYYAILFDLAGRAVTAARRRREGEKPAGVRAGASRTASRG